MADHSFSNAALVILPQSGQGTVNTTVTGLTTTVTTADGLIIGAGSKGDANTGITLPEHTRVGLELARIGNSAQADQFIRESAGGLAIAFPLAGGRNTVANPSIDGNFDLSTHFPGFDAILRGVGCAGAAGGGGTGSGTALRNYTPSASPTYCTVGLFFGGLKVVYLDVLVESLKLTLTPGESGIVEASFAIGSVYSWAAQTLSTITPGNQATAAPTVQGMGNAWGATRPWRALEITLAPDIQDGPDSNATTGIRKEIEAIDVGMKTTLLAATADPDYERDQMILTSANTADMTANLAATANGATANSYKIAVNNLVPRKIKPGKFGGYLGWEVEAEAKAISTAGTEFTLTFW